METPQIVWLCLSTFGIAVAAVKHGEPSGRHNFTTTIFATAINAAILWWGGFFGGQP